MKTKSVLQSKRSWLNYGSIVALALTAVFADESFRAMIVELLGTKGIIGMMIVGAVANQFLTQTSNQRPTFELPKKNLDVLIPQEGDE